MADRRRIARLEQQILQTVGPAIAHGLADPRLTMVTVTRIRLSADLSVARVNWSCLGEASERSRAQHAFEHARGHLQSIVARSLTTRVTPRLEFHYDDSLATAARVDSILADIARERGDEEEPEADGEADAAPPESTE